MRDPIFKFYDEDRSMTYNSMFYWFPRIRQLNIPMPRTEMVWLGKDKSYDLFSALDGNEKKADPILDEIYGRIVEKFPPGPMFIRGDHTSDKHGWEKTCFIKDNRDKTDVINHLFRLIDGHDAHVFIGPPMLGYALRELISTDPIFNTFRGNMPITREFRFFYSEGEVACFHPYWIPEAIECEKRFAWGKDLPEDWRERLDGISYIEDPDILELLSNRAIAIGRAIECDDVPSWSIDFLQGSDGIFYFIDCADALASEHRNDCPVGQEKFGWIPRVHEKESDFLDFLAEMGKLSNQMKKEEKQEVLDQRWELTGEETEDHPLERKQQMEIKPIHRCIVIDPPWPMKKIRREVRPNQVEMDYKTMSIDEIKDFPIRKFMHKDGCHVYLWTTQKYLQYSFDVFNAWGVKYQCIMTWVKNVGITPFSWMYSTEHVLFGMCGNIPLLRKGIRLDFKAKVRQHSRKPDEFYDIVRLVSSGPRVDIFSREKREGFDVWGYETEKFTERSLNYYR